MRCSSLSSAAVAAFALAAASLATPAAAQIAPGSLFSFTGSADARDIGTPGVVLDFTPTVVASATGNTGTFASLNRSSGVGVSGSIADLLVGRGPQPIANFLVIGGYRFDLLSLPGGPFGQRECYTKKATFWQTCTPYQSALGAPKPTDPLSPFYMVNVPSGIPEMPMVAVVSFNLIGTVTSATGATSSFFGTISTTLPGSYQEVLGGLEAAGAAEQSLPGIPFTGTFVVGGERAFLAAEFAEAEVVPEPATVALVAAGLAAVGAATRGRRRA